MTTPTDQTTYYAALRDQFGRVRRLRKARLALQSELAHYSTPAERLELAAMLERHPAERAAQIRSLLDA